LPSGFIFDMAEPELGVLSFVGVEVELSFEFEAVESAGLRLQPRVTKER